jgi:hypothetical protein
MEDKTSEVTEAQTKSSVIKEWLKDIAIALVIAIKVNSPTYITPF